MACREWSAPSRIDWVSRSFLQGFLRDCPTGKLDKKKFVDVYKQFYPHGKADSFCKYAFATFDANNDGTIDFDEFLLAIAATSQGDIDDRLEVAFEMFVSLTFAFDIHRSTCFLLCRYDVSGDGQIDQKELTNMIAAMVKFSDFFFFVFNHRSYFSTISSVKRSVKGKKIRRNVRSTSSANSMSVVIRNWTSKNSLLGKFDAETNGRTCIRSVKCILDAKMIQWSVACLHRTFKRCLHGLSNKSRRTGSLSFFLLEMCFYMQ